MLHDAMGWPVQCTRQIMITTFPRLVLPPDTRCATIGDRTVAGPQAWNSLPAEVLFSLTFSVFKQHLKYHLFQLSFPCTDFTTTYNVFV